MANVLRKLWNRIRRRPEKKQETHIYAHTTSCPQSHVSPLSIRDRLNEIQDRELEQRAEKIRKQFFPEPQTRRKRISRTTSSSSRPHHDASRFFKGQKTSKMYRKTIKQRIQPEGD